MFQGNEPVKSTRILIAENNPMDVSVLQHVFEQEPSWKTEFIVVRDGEEAVDYLLHPDRARPDLVILDLNLPGLNGVEVLQTIRMFPRLDDLRIAVLSSAPEEVIRSQIVQAHLRADAYINKPFGCDEFPLLAKRFHQCCELNLREPSPAPA